jgi:hypothetical protein
MKTLDELLDFIEGHIDEDHVRAVEQLHLAAMAFKPVQRLPLTLIYPPADIELYPYAEAWDDPEKMLFNELVRTVGGTSTYTSVLIKDDFPPHVRSNHGIGILASLFGARCKIINDNMPWVEHMELDAIKQAIRNGVPELEAALGQRVTETHQYMIEKLKKYPKCSRCIRISQPDLQGPFDIAHLLIGNDVFTGTYDFPELLHELLAVITDTYIAFRRHIEPLLTDRAGEQAVYVHGCLYGGKVLLKDDTAIVNLSEGMYREFSKPYNDRIFETFGGGSMHYCGPSRTWTQTAIDNPWLRGVNYGNPEQQDLAALYHFWADRQVPNLLWGDSLRGQRLTDRNYLAEINTLGIRTGMTLALRVDSHEEALSVLQAYRSARAE